MAIPIDQMPIGEGRHPDGEPGASFFIDRPTLEMIEKEGPDWKFDDARFLREAVSEPDTIFEGLKRANHEDCFCYCVRPTHDPDDPDAPRPLFAAGHPRQRRRTANRLTIIPRSTHGRNRGRFRLRPSGNRATVLVPIRRAAIHYFSSRLLATASGLAVGQTRRLLLFALLWPAVSLTE
jgi:hypothetical protein